MWIFRRFIKLCTFDIPPPSLSLSQNKKQGCKLPLTHSLMRVIFSVGDKNLRIWSPIWGVKFCRTSGIKLRFDFTFNFHFCLHYLQPLKNFIQLVCSLDHHHTKSCKRNVEIYSGGYHVKIFFSLILLSTLHWKCGPQNISVG